MYRAQRDRPLVRTRVWPRSHSLGYLYDAACRFAGFGHAAGGQAHGPVGVRACGGRRAVGSAARRRAGRARAASTTATASTATCTPGPRTSTGSPAGAASAARATSCSSTRSPCRSRSARRTRSSARCSGSPALARELAGTENLCLAGGVALNCKANGLLQRARVRAARAARRRHRARRSVARRAAARARRAAGSPPSSGRRRARRASTAHSTGCTARRCRSSASARALEAGRIGAIVDGPGEIGPRALGHRSIVADPSVPGMHGRLNTLKGREPWRPVRRGGAVARARPRCGSRGRACRTTCSPARRSRRRARRGAAGRRPCRRHDAPAGARPGVRRPARRAAARVGRAGRRGAGQHLLQRAGRADRVERRRRGARVPAPGAGLPRLDGELVARDAGWWRAV